MTNEQYEEFVESRVKPGKYLLEEASPNKMDAIHMALGVAGEAGELVDAIKKWTMYDKPLDVNNVVEELGDLEFYMAHIREIIGLTRREILLHNHAKLSKRYKTKFSNQEAHERNDKN